MKCGRGSFSGKLAPSSCQQLMMIDISQWRASIGLWRYSQARGQTDYDGRRRCCGPTINGKSGGTASLEKTTKLPAVLFLVFLHYLCYPILRAILTPPTGKFKK